MVKILLMLLLFFSGSCGTTQTNSRSESGIIKDLPSTATPTPTSIIQEMSQQTDNSNRAEETLEAVDFKKFTFPWYPKGYRPQSGKREVSLKNGELVVDQPGNTQDAWFSLVNVSKADLTGDDVKEAIVTVTASFNPGGSYACTFIYTLKANRPSLLWQHETGDRAYGGLRSIRFAGGSLIVEQYASKFGEAETPMCCPKRFQRLHYKWDGKHFQRIRTETLPNEYEDAKFLGYFNDSR